MSFYEICKVLISTETAYKDGAPHAMLTSIDTCTQKKVSSVEFDYQKVFDRDDKYEDVAGFYHTHQSKTNTLSSTDIETMNQWVRCLGKNLICIIETKEKINGWAFIRGEGLIVNHKKLQIFTENDVNYDVWFESRGKFWNSADFLVEGEYFDIDDEDEFKDTLDEVLNRTKILSDGQDLLNEKLQILYDIITGIENDE